ncbi:Polysaccharide monooxygenase Cel61a [Cyphellophora attinorum]|uniref:Polysaccharide monooxygenase Cel61a n=1 Tax=Cyphellophora attinorum TaxID=1664694 RepID=A0A0N1H616_9EURO|nr:Polysaccharide monooxygenase Cel61a [Phialophora attinorum]KPI38024.1 Polysaccharide monooxygenase Cel61a [Phialophora attinorum]
MHPTTATLLALTALATHTAAHGYVRTWTLDGVSFNGYSRSDGNPKPDAIGWSFTTPDEGPELDLTSPNFACRSGGAPASSSGQVAAGGTATFLWTSDDKSINPDGWSAGHRGPIMTYIAPCNGPCSSIADASTLKWTKIAEQGVTGPANTQGIWATDQMRANGGVAAATIPSSIAPGEYVLRNEIIALHRAHLSEPEFYMQCGNIEVTGSGTDDLSGQGVVASQLYSTSDEQIFGFSVYDNRGDGSEWIVPGPALYGGAAAAGAGNGTATPSTLPTGTAPSTVAGSQPGSTIVPSILPTAFPSNNGDPPASGNPWQSGRPRGSGRYGQY